VRIDGRPRKQSTESVSKEDNESGKLRRELHTASRTVMLTRQSLTREASTTEINSLLPISNIHTISKIIEPISLSRITAHVESSVSYNRSSQPTAVVIPLKQPEYVYWMMFILRPIKDTIVAVRPVDRFHTIDQNTLKSWLVSVGGYLNYSWHLWPK